MIHTLEAYWNSTFSQYKCADGSFSLPLFPDPLMSPNFNGGGPYLNEISSGTSDAPAAYKLNREFKVGTCDLTNWPILNLKTETVPLHVSVVRDDFWRILEASFPKDIFFLKKLLPFLPVTNAIYKTIFVKDELGQTAGLVNIGVGGGAALVLTAAVLPEHRGKKLTRQFVQIAGETAKNLNASRAIFWTDQAFLLKYAHEVHNYRIYLRENRPEAAQAVRPGLDS